MMSIRKFTNIVKKVQKDYIRKFLEKIPGEKRFGLYRLLPFFFLLGGSLEYLMINWKVGPNQVNFCKYF